MKRTFVIRNRLGLHARAAAQLVQLVSGYAAELSIEKDGQVVNGKSIMGLMMLAAGQGSVIRAEAEGEDAEAMLDAMGDLIEAKFHEGE